MRIDGRRVLVVGASGGIGKATATRLVHLGARVVFCGRRQDVLQAAVEAAGGGQYVVADVTDASQCNTLVQEAVGLVDGPDLIVFAASASRLGLLRDAGADEWQQVFATNVLGPSLVIKAALGHLPDAAVVAVLSSESAANPFAGLVPYAATKAALETMMCGWRVEHPELRFTNITVGSTGGTEFARDFDLELAAQLLPQWIASAQIPARSMDPDELGATIAEFLASAVAHPGVDCQQITLRAPGVLFSGDVDQVVRAVKPSAG